MSKTKPIEMIIECYEEGQRHFGENYIQELAEKANNKDILEKCKEIQWHYIGNVQSNKLNKILGIPNLYIIETVDREKIAEALNKSWPKFNENGEKKLNVFIQVNTSGEEAKGGVEPTNVISLAKFVIEQCPNLKFDGLMTIGRFDYNVEDGPNPDFLCLKRCRDEICQHLEIDWKDVKLSMGMSDDFEHAVS